MQSWPQVVTKGFGVLLLNSTHINDNTPHVVPTLRAHGVCRNGGAAAAADLQLLGLLVMMSAAFAGPRIGVSSLGNCHRYALTKWTAFLGQASYGEAGNLSSRNQFANHNPTGLPLA